MKETESSQIQGVRLPPTWCSGICRNAMSNLCVEHCAINRDCSHFEPTQIKLADMPKFPETKGLTREERFAVVTVYLAKVVETLQGEPNVPAYDPIRRPSFDRSAGSRISTVVQVKDLLPNLTQAISPLSDQQERADTGVGIETVAQPAD